MSRWPFRVTQPLIQVVATLARVDSKVHGWAVAEESGEPAPNVYRALERLRAAGWVSYEWEARNPEPGRPPRRLYWLTPEGRRAGGELLAERGPK